MTSVDRLGSHLELLQSSRDERDVTGAQLAERAYLSRFHFDLVAPVQALTLTLVPVVGAEERCHDDRQTGSREST